MLKLPLSSTCNASSADNYQAKKRHLIGASLTPFSIRRPNASVSCASSSSSSVSDPILTVATGETKGKDAGLEKSLGDRLRLGSLMEDGSSYKEKFIVRCFEVGINKTATIETIANLLQEVACNHIQSIGFSRDGFGTAHTMRKLNLIWVIARMHIEIYKYPTWSDVVEIETWFHCEGRIGTRRDWILKDCATDEVIGRATSKWVMMNQGTRRFEKVRDDVQEEYLGFSPKELRFAFPEEKNKSLKKILKLKDPARYSRPGLVPRRVDLDMNQHINNVTYIGWVLESMPREIIDTHELQTITLDYRRECQRDDIVDSLTSQEEDMTTPKLKVSNGYAAAAIKGKEDHCQFLHLLRLSGDGLEINRARTEWRKKSARQAHHSV